MLYMAQPTFPVFPSRWDELAQPEQTATPSSIPSGSQAALYDIARSPLEESVSISCSDLRGSNTRTTGSATATAQQVSVGGDVMAAGGMHAAPFDLCAP